MRILSPVIAVLLTFGLAACDNFETRHKKTVEQRLVEAFADSPAEMRQRIQEVVAAGEVGAYQDALNGLALIAATTRLTPPQKRALDDLMRQFRYDMEEEELADGPGATPTAKKPQ